MNLRSIRLQLKRKQIRLRRALDRIERKPPRGLDAMAAAADAEVWKQVDCLSCANCCKAMSPTYTDKDIRRISAHLSMTPKAFKEKWLILDEEGDWMNRRRPCQFLNLTDNKCSIYEVRPADCAGFPHLTKRKMTEYMHVHKQNVEYCPATQRFVELLEERIATYGSRS